MYYFFCMSRRPDPTCVMRVGPSSCDALLRHCTLARRSLSVFGHNTIPLLFLGNCGEHLDKMTLNTHKKQHAKLHLAFRSYGSVYVRGQAILGM